MDGKSKKSKDGDMVSKFQGEGMSFRAKLYGSVEVKEARGDAMCQQSLQVLKSNIKGNGVHKKKIVFRINIKGVTLLDSANSAILHQHPVNRISFISKDRTDSRSFAYVVGLTGGKHELFGVKTEKASDVVVLALRDLFQAVYQLSQREAQSQRSGSRTSSQSLDSQNNQPIFSNLSASSLDNTSTSPKSSAPGSPATTDSLNGANTPHIQTSQHQTLLNTEIATSPPTQSQSQEDSSNCEIAPVISLPTTNMQTEGSWSHSKTEVIAEQDALIGSPTLPNTAAEEVSISTSEVPNKTLSTPENPPLDDQSTTPSSKPDDLFSTPNPIADNSFTATTLEDPFVVSEPKDPFIAANLMSKFPLTTPETASQEPLTSQKSTEGESVQKDPHKATSPEPTPEPTQLQDPVAAPETDPERLFTTQKVSDDPFTAPAPENQFATTEPSEDPFSAPKSAEDPFNAPELMVQDPFNTSTPGDPFNTGGDPFSVPQWQSRTDSSNPWGAIDAWNNTDTWNPFAPEEMNPSESQNAETATVEQASTEAFESEAVNSTSDNLPMQNELAGPATTTDEKESAEYPKRNDVIEKCPSDDTPLSKTALHTLETEDSARVSAVSSTKVSSEANPFEPKNNPWEMSGSDPFADFAIPADKFDPFAVEDVFVSECGEPSNLDSQHPDSAKSGADDNDTGNTALEEIDPFNDSWFKGINLKQQADKGSEVGDEVEIKTSIDTLVDNEKTDEKSTAIEVQSDSEKLAAESLETGFYTRAVASGDTADSSVTETCDEIGDDDIARESEPPSTQAPSLPSEISDKSVDMPPPSMPPPAMPPPTMPPPTMPPPAMPPRKSTPPAVPKRRLSSGPAPPIPSRPTTVISPNQPTVPAVGTVEDNDIASTAEPPSLPPPSVPPPSVSPSVSPPSLPPRVPQRTNT